MKLNLKNPLVFFDLETTGTNINTDRIVEICYLKVYPNGNEEAKTLRINPEMHIPEASTAIHGIHDEDVADCPTFKEVAKDIARDIEGADIAGFNSNRFDVPVLVEEFLRAGIDIDLTKRKFVDVQVIYHKLEQRTLSAAYKFYCGKDLEDAHTAEADTRATYEVLRTTSTTCRNIPATARTWTLPEESCMTTTAWKCSTSGNTKVFLYRKCSRKTWATTAGL